MVALEFSRVLTIYVCHSQIVLENSSREDKHECPFGRCAIELTRMLCEILQVGELREYTSRRWTPHITMALRLTRRSRKPQSFWGYSKLIRVANLIHFYCTCILRGITDV